MTAPKIRACPRCERDDHLSVYKYDHGWQHVECDHCFYMGPGEGSSLQAIKSHNKRSDETIEKRRRERAALGEILTSALADLQAQPSPPAASTNPATERLEK